LIKYLYVFTRDVNSYDEKRSSERDRCGLRRKCIELTVRGLQYPSLTF